MKEYNFKINGADYNVVIGSTEGNIANVSVNGVSYQVEIGGAAPVMPAADAQTQTAQPQSAPASQPAPAVSQAAPAAKPSGEGKPVTSPLPGVIVEISVKEGDTISAGQKVAVLEAMKMENEILSENAGTVTMIHVAKGDSVLEGAVIVTVA